MSVYTKANFLTAIASLFSDALASKATTRANVRTMATDISDSAMFIQDNFIDEDSFASDSAVKAPSQQSTKAYIAAQISGGASAVNDTDIKSFYQDDFMYASSIGFSVSAGGSGATGLSASTDTNYINTTEKCAGLISAELGTTTTGRSHAYRGLLKLTYLAISLRHRFAINTLSDGTDTYFVRFGMSDLSNITSSPGDPDNGIYFKYSHGTNSGKWQAVCTSATTSTTSDTGITATAGQMEVFKISINEAGTSVTFYINGASVATISTNIPTSSILLYSYWHAHKTAGTTTRKFFMDWYDELFTKASAR